MLGVANIVLRTVGASAPPPSAQLVSRWTLDEASGTTATDAAGHSDGSYTGIALQQDPLVEDDLGSSVRFFGNSAIAVPHVAAYEVESYSVVVYGQVQSGPGPGANAQLVQKDRGGLPGGFQIAVVNDGGTLRPQVFTKDQSGNAIWVGSSNGVGQVVPGTAFMLVMTCGGSGTRLHLDKTEIGSNNNHVGLAGNNEQIGIGRYRPGISDVAGFNGWIDEVRLYEGVLTPDEIAALPSAQDLVLPGIEPETYAVPVVPSAPSGTQIYVATTGNDSSGNGSIGSPYRTLSKALSVASSGSTIVLRAGVYREANLAAGITNLTIKGYHEDIAADPLDPDNWPIIDGQAESSIVWELVDAAAGRQEYRTVATNIAGGTAVPQGLVTSGLSPRLPRYEPANGEVDPTPTWRLYPYRGTTGPRSKAAFQHTGAVSLNQNTGYNGPGLYRESDGRIHIRLQPIHSSYYGGEAWDKIADKNPANNTIGIWPQGRTCFSTLANGFHIEGIFVRHFDKFYAGAGRNGTMKGSIWFGMDFQNYGFRFTSGTATFVVDSCIISAGMPDPWAWHLIKNVSDNGGLNYGRTTPFNLDHGSYNFRITNSMIFHVFDVLTGSGLDVNAPIEIDHNYIDVRDDVHQCSSDIRRMNVHHNFIVGPALGHQGEGVPADPVEWYLHHNIILVHRMYLNQVGQRTGHHAHSFHSAASDCPQKIYHNLYCGTHPVREPVGPHVWHPGYNNTGARTTYSFNNIYLWYPQVPPGGSASGDTFLARRFRVHSDQHRTVWDGHGYWNVHGPGVTAAKRLWQQVWTTGTSNEENFANLAAWKASSKYTGTIGRNGYANGIDTNSIQQDPLLQGGTTAMLAGDPRGRPASDWKPTAAAYKTGAVNITGFGWPGASSYEPWRGPMDPDGDATEVGPRIAG
jgi:Concanavalin A-like lectin/glucanases superfamily/Protein of unknown function (DUF1565)